MRDARWPGQDDDGGPNTQQHDQRQDGTSRLRREINQWIGWSFLTGELRKTNQDRAGDRECAPDATGRRQALAQHERRRDLGIRLGDHEPTVQRGMRTLREDGIRKVLAGLTSGGEVVHATMSDAD
mgnify:CR=1 FL=1